MRLPTKEERDGIELLLTRFPDGSQLTAQESAALEYLDELRQAKCQEWIVPIDETACLSCLSRQSDHWCTVGDDPVAGRSLATATARDRRAPGECPLRSGSVLLRAKA